MVALLLYTREATSGYAPDRPPVLPSDWCAEKEGTLTRSTGKINSFYEKKANYFKNREARFLVFH
jgi:hypothetical protein